MKKLLLAIVALLAYSGSIFAQDDYPFETRWPFNDRLYESQTPVVAFIQINGNYVDVTNWESLELGAFVNGETRGHDHMFDWTDDGDPYPIIDGMAIFYNGNGGEEISFMLYDHATGIEYTEFSVFQMGYPETLMTLLTGEWHDELYFDTDDAIVISFTGGSTPVQSYTLDITGVGEENWNTSNNGGYYLIASPLADETSPSDVDNMINDDDTYDLYLFDQSGVDSENAPKEWQNYRQHYFSLEPGKGYLYASKEDVTLTFTGMPVDGDGMEIGLVYSAESRLPGWNLIGNPFTVNATVDRDCYVINPEDGRNEIILVNNYTLAPMEGAFVHAESEGLFVNVSKSAKNNNARLNLNLSKDRGVIDRAAVNFGEGSLPKFQLNPNHTKLYIPQDGKDYAAVSCEEMGTLPVNLKAEKSGTYTLSFSAEEVSFNYLHLIDNLNGNDVDLLANPSYTFNASITDNASRFTLVFATGNDNGENFAFFNNGAWIINNDGEATLQVVDALGRVLSSETVSGSCSKTINAAAGVYMLRLINSSNDVKVQKILVNN